MSARSSAPRSWGFSAVVALLASLVVALIVMAFVWPAATSEVRGLAVGVAGPANAVEQLQSALADQDPAPFVLEPVDSSDDAAELIGQRELYGAILLTDPTTGEAPEVLVATAASPVAANALRGVATQLQSRIDQAISSTLADQLTAIVQALQSGQQPQPPSQGGMPGQTPQVTVTDLAPLAPGDHTGAGLAASVFPLVLGGLAGGIILCFAVRGVGRRLVGLAVYGIAAGALIALVMQTWFEILQGPWLLNATVAGLSVMATAALVIGLHSLMGGAGIGIAAIITMLIGNPIAGAAAPPEFLPEPWGAIGQGFVPGASATLLRSVGYFPDAHTAVGWLTLLAWLAAGVLLALAGLARERRGTTAASTGPVDIEAAPTV